MAEWDHSTTLLRSSLPEETARSTQQESHSRTRARLPEIIHGALNEAPAVAQKRVKLAEDTMQYESFCQRAAATAQVLEEVCQEIDRRIRDGDEGRKGRSLLVVSEEGTQSRPFDIVVRVSGDAREAVETLRRMAGENFALIRIECPGWKAPARDAILRALARISARRLLINRTHLTMKTFAELTTDKNQVIIEEEVSCMYSTAYIDMVQRMRAASLGVRECSTSPCLLRTPLRCSAFVVHHFIVWLTTAAPFRTQESCNAIYAHEEGFRLIFDKRKGYLKVARSSPAGEGSTAEEAAAGAEKGRRSTTAARSD